MGPPDSGESYLKHSASTVDSPASSMYEFSFAQLPWGQSPHPQALDSTAS